MSPDSAAVAGEVGVVEDVVVEAVRREDVAAVVGLVERPVVAQRFGHEHEHAVVAQLVVLDDRQRLEGLSEADAVGDDAAAEALQLVDGADHAVALELVELFPDDRVADAGGGLDDALLVQLVATVAEEVMEDERVDQERVAVRRQRLQCGDRAPICGPDRLQARPLRVEPLAEQAALFRGLGRLDQAQRVAGRDAEPIGAEGERSEHDLLGPASPSRSTMAP